MIWSASVAILSNNVNVTGASSRFASAVSGSDSGAGAGAAGASLKRGTPVPRQAFSTDRSDGVSAAFEAFSGAAIAGVGVVGVDEAVASARLTTDARHRIAEKAGLASVVLL